MTTRYGRLILVVPLVLSFVLIGLQYAAAEGTKDIHPNGASGTRAWTEWRTDMQAGIGSSQSDGILRRTVVKAYVEQGEDIYLASSVLGMGNAKIQVYRPDNSTWELEVGSNSPDWEWDSPSGSHDLGLIEERDEEIEGPNLNSQTDNDKFYPRKINNAPITGIYVIFFTSPDENATGSSDNPPAIGADEDWENYQSDCKAYMAAWDVTVTASNGTTKREGRVFVNYFAFNLGANSQSLSAEVYPLTKDGLRYRVNFNLLDPFGFLFYTDNKGIIDRSTKEAIYQSEALSGSNPDWYFPLAGTTQVHNPGLRNNTIDELYTHKIFLNTPDIGMPTTAMEASESRWLYTAWSSSAFANTLSVDSVSFKGNEAQTFGAAGFRDGSNYFGTLTFFMDNSSSSPKNFVVHIDMSNSGVGNGNYFDAVDVVFQGTCPGSASSAPVVVTPVWYGIFGDGSTIPPQTFNSLNYRIYIVGGEVHFPLIDAESNSQGLIVQRMGSKSGAISGDFNTYHIAWDDSPVGGTSNLAGTSSSSGAHSFSSNFGDGKVIDSWSLYHANPLDGSFGPVSFREADLEFTSAVLLNTQSAGDPQRGQTAQLRFTLRNLGDMDVTGTGINFDNQKAQIDIEVVTADVSLTDSIAWYIEGPNISPTRFYPADNFHPANTDLSFPINTFASGDSVIITMNFTIALGPNPLSSASFDVEGKIFRPEDYNDPDNLIRYNPVTPSNNLLSETLGALPLPVELTSFSGRTIDGNVQLKWSTATEVNNYGFEVERAVVSNAGAPRWENIGFVEGNGTVNTPQQYGYMDQDARNHGNVLAYRLKQVDLDGTFKYSPTVQVRFNGTTSFTLAPSYPNPVSTGGDNGDAVTTLGFTLSKAGDIRLSVYNASGREVKVVAEGYYEAGSYTAMFDVKNVQPGTYMTVLTSNGQRSVQKMVVVR